MIEPHLLQQIAQDGRALGRSAMFEHPRTRGCFLIGAKSNYHSNTRQFRGAGVNKVYLDQVTYEELNAQRLPVSVSVN